MLKRLTFTLMLAFLSLFLALSHFAAAQGGESGAVLDLRKTPINPPSTEAFVQKTMTETTRTFPFNSYGSSDFFFPPYPSESDRLGYGKTSDHNAASLHAGWYVDWRANISSKHPGGVEYARTIMFDVHDTGIICNKTTPAPATAASQVTANLTGTALISNVLINPGALWLIGNEFDAPYNGSPLKAELYAELYHYFYTTIKAADPTAKVAIGAVSQPSPVRMEYLDKILNHYQAQYGQPFPTDLWNIHFYYMNEKACDWGASLPPFASSPELAWYISVKEFLQGYPLDLQELETHLRDFRQWMYERGYRDIPLIITEYGILATSGFGGPYTNENAALFLRDSMQMLRTITETSFITSTSDITGSWNFTDTTIGYPADDYRLAQMWNWFSTEHKEFGGNLFYENGDLTVIGMAFGYETLSNFTPYIDLEIITPFSPVSATNIFTWEVFANNRGNITATDTTISSTLFNYFDRAVISNSVEVIGSYPPRYRQEPLQIERSWPFTPPAAYTMTMAVDAYQNDVITANNRVEQLFAIYPDLAVTRLNAPAVIDWRKSGSDTFGKANVTVSATIVNVGNWTSTLTPMTMKLHPKSDPFLSDTRSMIVPVLAPQEVFTVSETWLLTGVGSYIATVLVNSPYEPTRELHTHNNISTSVILVPDHWTFLPLVTKNATSTTSVSTTTSVKLR